MHDNSDLSQSFSYPPREGFYPSEHTEDTEDISTILMYEEDDKEFDLGLGQKRTFDMEGRELIDFSTFTNKTPLSTADMNEWCRKRDLENLDLEASTPFEGGYTIPKSRQEAETRFLTERAEQAHKEKKRQLRAKMINSSFFN